VYPFSVRRTKGRSQNLKFFQEACRRRMSLRLACASGQRPPHSPQKLTIAGARTRFEPGSTADQAVALVAERCRISATISSTARAANSIDSAGRAVCVLASATPNAESECSSAKRRGADEMSSSSRVSSAGAGHPPDHRGLRPGRATRSISPRHQCRPPENRKPRPRRVETCAPSCFQQSTPPSRKSSVASAPSPESAPQTQDPISRLRVHLRLSRAKPFPTFPPGIPLPARSAAGRCGKT